MFQPLLVAGTVTDSVTVAILLLLLQGLQQHMQASHDLFDFGCSQRGSGLGPPSIPCVNVRCPAELYDQQGHLQSVEAAHIGAAHQHKVGTPSPLRVVYSLPFKFWMQRFTFQVGRSGVVRCSFRLAVK